MPLLCLNLFGEGIAFCNFYIHVPSLNKNFIFFSIADFQHSVAGRYFYHMRLYSMQASISLKNNMNSSHSYYTRTAEFLHLLMAIIFIAAWVIDFLMATL